MNNFPYCYPMYPYSYPFFYPFQQTPYFPNFMIPFPQFQNATIALEKSRIMENRQQKQQQRSQVKVETQVVNHSLQIDPLPSASENDRNEKRQRGVKKDQDNLYIPKKFKDNYLQTINNLYTIKNIEANVVNQVYSFMSNQQKRAKYVSEYFGDDCDKVSKFNHYFKIIKKCNKRYIKKSYLVHLCKLQNGHVGHAKLVRNENHLKVLSIQQFCKCVRYLVRLYLSKLCPIAILTSKKMNKDLWLRHLNKCRQINDYVFCSEQQRKQYQLQQKVNQQINGKLLEVEQKQGSIINN